MRGHSTNVENTLWLSPEVNKAVAAGTVVPDDGGGFGCGVYLQLLYVA